MGLGDGSVGQREERPVGEERNEEEDNMGPHISNGEKEVNCNDKSVNLKIVMVRIQSTFFYLGRSVPFIQSPKI